MDKSHIEVEVRFFAAAREATGRDGVQIEIPVGATVAQVREVVATLWPHPVFDRCLWAIDEQPASDDTPLVDGQRLAVLPPVGGG